MTFDGWVDHLMRDMLDTFTDDKLRVRPSTRVGVHSGRIWRDVLPTFGVDGCFNARAIKANDSE